jgi:hypothetical protein
VDCEQIGLVYYSDTENVVWWRGRLVETLQGAEHKAEAEALVL